jgi:thiol-disulfide isomerase/thioredoxin
MKILSIMMAGVVFTFVTAGAALADGGGMMPGMVMEAKSAHGTYADNSPAGFEAAKDQKRVYFFAASWCPTCTATDKALKASAKGIPAGVAIFKADFDSSTDLKAKYGVTHMDTFVQVDKDGAKIKSWNGGGAEGIAKNIS